MNILISDFIASLELSEPQVFGNMGVFPLFYSTKPGPRYLTMKEALERNYLIVTELNEYGSVPELKVVNRASVPVLLLDGEELAGAKQNRVLNTTILLKKLSETVIPVSCTEQGRWTYDSPVFSDSGNVLFSKARAAKSRSVTESLNYSQRFRSNQGQVWTCIRKLASQADVHSNTEAMKDVFEAKARSMEKYLAAFPCLENQKGLIVFINGKVAGCDILSRDSAYKVLHPKLLKSYLIEALLTKDNKQDGITREKVEIFFGLVRAARDKRFKSAGHGWDYRFEGEGVVGSVLLYRKKIIHAAFFQAGESDISGGMSGYRKRAGFRK